MNLKGQTLTDDIAQAICKGSRNHPDFCPFCLKNGRCDPKMWRTFQGEAESVLSLLKTRGILKTQTLLPGLGG